MAHNLQQQEYVTKPKSWALSELTYYEPISNLTTYHHSKTFIASTGVNPLLTAASAVIIIMTKLGKTGKYDNLSQLQRDLIYEIRAFECNSLAYDYSPHVITAARFALCAALDETIANTIWGRAKSWQNYSLTAYFYRGNTPNLSFLIMIEKSLTNPDTPTDLLELFYICLNLAYVGTYRIDASEFAKINRLSDSLYQTVNKRKKRNKVTKSNAKKKTTAMPSSKNKSNVIPLWLISVIVILLLASIYTGFNYLLGTTTQPVYTKLEHIIDNADETYR